MKSKRINFILISAMLLVSAAFIAGAVLVFKNLPRTSAEYDGAYDNTPVIFYSETDEMRGVWIATVANINFPSKRDLSAKALRAEIDDIVSTSKSAGLNTIYFQVRPCADALYNSKLFPVSEYLSDKGELVDGFDPLAYIIEKAHENGMKLSAWINPYRVTYGSSLYLNHDLTKLDALHPARLNPEWTVAYPDGMVYFNPGIPEVRDYIVEGIKEIVQNYDVDGIHMDDYFYPYPVYETVEGKSVKAVFDDAEEYQKYSDGIMSLADWRRQNVNIFVEQTYNAVKSIDPDVRFGISPFGIWANSSTNAKGSATNGLQAYYDIYCDPISWIEGEYIDYICPQIYWEFSSKSAPFDVLVKWWSRAVDGTDIDLYIGHAAYRTDEFSYEEEIVRQIQYARQWMGYSGSVLYGYEQIKKNTCGLADSLASLYSAPVTYDTTVGAVEGVVVGKPADGRRTVLDNLHLLAASDPNYPVFYEGEKVSRTKSGFFNIYLTLKEGDNKVTFIQNGKDYSINIIKYKSSASAEYTTLDGMQITSVYPTEDIILSPGTQISVSCRAPSGSSVTASVGNAVVKLKPSIYPPDNSEYMSELYEGVITLPSATVSGVLEDIGNITFAAEREGERAAAEGSSVKLLTNGYLGYVEVVDDYAYLKTSRTSSFYDDYLNASAGMRDYITQLHRGYYKLRFGGYIAADDVVFVDGGKLLENKFLSAYMTVDGKTTDLVFGVTEHVPLTAECRNGIFTLKFFNTDSLYTKDITVVDNPLFNSCTMTAADDTVTYTLKLKDQYNYYGFDVAYDNNVITLSFTNPQTLADGDKPLAGKRIIVDAGHGGTDNGATGYISTGKDETNESDINLAVSLQLEKKLRELGAEVIMTRTAEVEVDINYRMDFLNEVHPDLCISIHHNALADESDISRVRGFVALYWSEAGKLLTKTVSNTATDKMFIYERTPTLQKLALCRNYKFPQTLLELGFITNATEYESLVSSDYSVRWADAIADGVLDYYRAQEEFID